MLVEKIYWNVWVSPCTSTMNNAHKPQLSYWGWVQHELQKRHEDFGRTRAKQYAPLWLACTVQQLFRCLVYFVPKLQTICANLDRMWLKKENLVNSLNNSNAYKKKNMWQSWAFLYMSYLSVSKLSLRETKAKPRTYTQEKYKRQELDVVKKKLNKPSSPVSKIMHIARIRRTFVGGSSSPQLAALFTGHVTYRTLMGCSGWACPRVGSNSSERPPISRGSTEGI